MWTELDVSLKGQHSHWHRLARTVSASREGQAYLRSQQNLLLIVGTSTKGCRTTLIPHGQLSLPNIIVLSSKKNDFLLFAPASTHPSYFRLPLHSRPLCFSPTPPLHYRRRWNSRLRPRRTPMRFASRPHHCFARKKPPPQRLPRVSCPLSSQNVILLVHGRPHLWVLFASKSGAQ